MILRAEGIARQFLRKRADSNVFWAVQETSIALREGAVTVLSGPSGSGKSTLLNMLSGILQPSKGHVLLGEQDLYAMNDRTLSEFRGKHFGVIPQGQTALHALTVLENVLLPQTLRNEKANVERAKELLEQMSIADLANVMPSELSGGEMRRMAVARALICEPEVVFADEPTADLDASNAQIVLKMLRSVAESGKTVFVVTHDSDVVDIADVNCIMNNGQLQIKE